MSRVARESTNHDRSAYGVCDLRTVLEVSDVAESNGALASDGPDAGEAEC